MWITAKRAEGKRDLIIGGPKKECIMKTFRLGGLMNLEKQIILYLTRYGNTREKDLVSFAIQEFGRSGKDMKKVIDWMVVKGRIHRIIHNKLRPPEVYLALKEPFHPNVLKALTEVDILETIEKDVQNILEEAAAIAEKRTRETESREP